MPVKPLTVAVPETLLKRIRGRARQAKRTVEAEVVKLLTDAVSADGATHGDDSSPPSAKKKPRTSLADRAEVNGSREGSTMQSSARTEREYQRDWESAVAQVPQLDDRALRKAVKPLMTCRQSDRLADLNYKAQDTGLTAAEKVEQRELLHVSDKSMVVRAAVLAELHKRGVDVSEFVAP